MSARYWREYYLRHANPVSDKEQRLYYPIIKISAHIDESVQEQNTIEHKELEAECSLLVDHDKDPTNTKHLSKESDIVILNSLAIKADRDEHMRQPCGMNPVEVSESDPVYSVRGAHLGLNLLRVNRNRGQYRSLSATKSYPLAGWDWDQWRVPWKWLETISVKSRRQKQWSCSYCCIWSCLTLFFIILLTTIVTWSITKTYYKGRNNEPLPIIIRGTMRFLIMENHGIFPIKSILNKRAVTIKQTYRDILNQGRFCARAGSQCDLQWRTRIKEEFPLNCQEEDWYPNQTAWPLAEKLTSYVINNSTFCFWHACVALDICCWRAPTSPSVAMFAYALHLRLSDKDSHSTSSDTLGALSSKFCSMTAQSLLHRILELAIFGDLRNRIQEKEVCIQQIILPHASSSCVSVERCVRQ